MIKKYLSKNNYSWLLILIMFFMFALIGVLSGANWFSFNSEAEIYTFGKNFIQTGDLSMELSEVQSKYPYLFKPEGYGFNDENMSYVPKLAIGSIIFTSETFLLGDQGIFVFFALVSLITGLLVYTLSRNLFDTTSRYLLPIFIFSTPILLWSNFAYANLLGVTLVIIATIFIVRAIDKGYFDSSSIRPIFDKDLFIGFLFASGALLTRYELVIFFLFLGVVILFKKRNFKRYISALTLLIPVFTLVMLIPFMYLNNDSYGKFFTAGYLNETELSSQSSTKESSSFLTSVLKRFPLLRYPVKELGLVEGSVWILRNLFYFFIRLIPLQLFFLFLLFSKVEGRRRIKESYNKITLVVLTMFSLFIIYFEASAYHLGWNSGSITGFYSRYWFLPLILVLIIGGQYLIKNKYAYLLTQVTVMLSLLIFLTLPQGANSWIVSREEKHVLYEWSQTIDPNSIIITDIVSKTFVDSNVLQPLSIDGFGGYNAMFSSSSTPDLENILVLAEIIEEVPMEVYLVELPSHQSTYFYIADYLKAVSDSEVTQIEIDGVEQVNVYKLK